MRCRPSVSICCGSIGTVNHQHWPAIRRLTAPLDEALAVLHWCPDTVFQRRFARYATAIVLHRCGELGSDFWSWSTQEWADLLRRAAAAAAIRGAGRHAGTSLSARPCLSAHRVHRLRPGRAVRAADVGAESIRRRRRRGGDRTRSRGAQRLGIPRRESGVDDLHVAAAQPQPDAERSDLRRRWTGCARTPAIERHFHGRHLHGVHRALAALGHTGPPPAPRYGDGPSPSPAPPRAGRTRSNAGTPPRRSNRAPATPTASCWPRSADGSPPNIPTSPGRADWTRQTCTAWIAAVDRMRVGDHIQSQNWRDSRTEQLGKPLSPKTKRTYIRIARTFFRDLQDWDWIPRRFDPARALETPRSIRALQGPIRG